MQKDLQSGIIHFWLVVYGLSQFLARGNSCRKIFGSWWLVVVVVINVLARGGLWWLVCCFRNHRLFTIKRGITVEVNEIHIMKNIACGM